MKVLGVLNVWVPITSKNESKFWVRMETVETADGWRVWVHNVKVTRYFGEPPGSEHQMRRRSDLIRSGVWLCKTRGTCEIPTSQLRSTTARSHHFKRPRKVGFGSNRQTDDCREVSCHWHNTKCSPQFGLQGITDTGNVNRQDTHETLDLP